MTRKPRITRATPCHAPDSNNVDARQRDKGGMLISFEDAARQLDCDANEARFNAALGKIARHKPKPDAPPEKAETTEKKEPAK